MAPPRTDSGGAAPRALGPVQRICIRLGVGSGRAADYAGYLYDYPHQGHAVAGGHGAWQHVELCALDLRRPYRLRPVRRTLQPRPIVDARTCMVSQDFDFSE